MKRLVIHLVIAAATFSSGSALKFILAADHHGTNAADATEVKLASLYVCGLPVHTKFRLPEPNLIFEHAPGRFNPSGDYHPVNRMEVESEKSTYFDLTVRRRKGKLVAWGEIKSHGTSYKFASISVTEQRLKFTTVNLRGVEYRFEGRLLGSGDFAGQTTDYGRIMLAGTLQKFVNGERVAQTVSPFLYFPGC